MMTAVLDLQTIVESAAGDVELLKRIAHIEYPRCDPTLHANGVFSRCSSRGVEFSLCDPDSVVDPDAVTYHLAQLGEPVV